jgi:hypothetical protein
MQGRDEHLHVGPALSERQRVEGLLCRAASSSAAWFSAVRCRPRSVTVVSVIAPSISKFITTGNRVAARAAAMRAYVACSDRCRTCVQYPNIDEQPLARWSRRVSTSANERIKSAVASRSTAASRFTSIRSSASERPLGSARGRRESESFVVMSLCITTFFSGRR